MPPPAGAFIPLMTLGIPPNVVMALLLGAFIMHGLQPGPLLMIQQPDLFWGIVASMYIGNVMLLVLNMPLIGMWVQVLKLPYRILFPLILMFCIVGVFASGNAVFDVFVMVVFGVLGYLMRKFGYEPAPLVLAFVLGPDAREQLAEIADSVAGRLHDLHRVADLGGVHGAGRRGPCRASAAGAGAPAQSRRHGSNLNAVGEDLCRDEIFSARVEIAHFVDELPLASYPAGAAGAARLSISIAPALIRGISSRPNSVVSATGSKPRIRNDETPRR